MGFFDSDVTYGGAYNLPTKTYVEDPYDNRPLGGTYSSTSTILNVDIYSLS